MSSGGGFGVAVTVSLGGPVLPPAAHVVPPGVTRRRARLAEILEPAGFSDAGLVDELLTLVDGRSQFAAYEAVVVAEMAARRPAETDLAEDVPGHRVEGWTPDRGAGGGE